MLSGKIKRSKTIWLLACLAMMNLTVSCGTVSYGMKSGLAGDSLPAGSLTVSDFEKISEGTEVTLFLKDGRIINGVYLNIIENETQTPPSVCLRESMCLKTIPLNQISHVKFSQKSFDGMFALGVLCTVGAILYIGLRSTCIPGSIFE